MVSHPNARAIIASVAPGMLGTSHEYTSQLKSIAPRANVLSAYW